MALFFCDMARLISHHRTFNLDGVEGNHVIDRGNAPGDARICLLVRRYRRLSLRLHNSYGVVVRTCEFREMPRDRMFQNISYDTGLRPKRTGQEAKRGHSKSDGPRPRFTPRSASRRRRAIPATSGNERSGLRIGFNFDRQSTSRLHIRCASWLIVKLVVKTAGDHARVSPAP